MAKASVPGLTKTRLVPPLTPAQAAAMNSAFLSDITDNLALAARETAIAAYLAFGPPGSAPFFAERFPAAIGLIEVWFPDFGDCLFHTLEHLLALGYGAACVLNSDSPTLPTARLVEAARLLAEPGERVVMGPSTDGGYYLLGMTAPHRRLFEDIAWSTASVARETAERAKERGLELVTLAPWYDVDDAATLEQLASELDPAARRTTGAHVARHSAAALRGLVLPTRSDAA